MVHNYIRKSNRQSWLKDAMICAILAVMDGSTTDDAASSHYKVPRLPLQDREKQIKERNINVQQCGLKNISIQNEHDYTEVNATLAITTNNTQTNNQEQLHTDCKDEDSIKGRFSWKLIDEYHVPYIIRIINGVKLKFVSVRMAEIQLLSKFLPSLGFEMLTCTLVRSYFITESEAVLLNNINHFHSDFAFGNTIFFARKDNIVLLDDVHEFYTFIDVCYKTLLFDNNTGIKEKCGFILINSESLVPYCIKDSQKYVPLFCFEGATENLQHLAVKLKNWNLAYLKFCCKVQGIVNNEFFTSDSCTVISLDDIKSFYSTETNFEEHWPSKIIDTQLLTNQNSTHVNPPRIKTPLEEVIVDNSTITHTLTESAPVLPQSMPVMSNTYQNELPANQMINSYSNQAQLPYTTTAITRDYSIATRNHSLDAQCYNAGSSMSQVRSLMISADNVVPPPPLFESVKTIPVISDTASYCNVVSISQCMTTIYNTMTNRNVMTHSNQMQQVYSQCAINNGQAQQQQIQQQQHHQQQKITDPQSQPSYSSQSVHGCLTSTQLHSTLRNVGPIITTPVTESILSSQPCNPMPPTVETFLRPRVRQEWTRIPGQTLANGTNITAYKIEKATLQGRIIYCVNAIPYKYSDLLITLKDLIQIVLPTWTVPKCAHFLQNYLNITLFSGTFEQLALLRENGLISSIDPEGTPMAMLQDIKNWLNAVTGPSQLLYSHRHQTR